LVYCSAFPKIVQNLTEYIYILYGVLCNIAKDPFLFCVGMQMVTRNFGMDVHCVVSEDDTRHCLDNITLKLCELFLDTASHPDLDVKELRSETIVQVIRAVSGYSGAYSGAHIQLMEGRG